MMSGGRAVVCSVLAWWVVFLSAPSAGLLRYANGAFTRIGNGPSLGWKGSFVIFGRLPFLHDVVITPRIFIEALLSPPVTAIGVARSNIARTDAGWRKHILSDCGTYHRQNGH